uniref:Uncharacterized protein n=1 Tax=Panagrolaimus superbus TaxID=310955 RepID=A0A914XXK1_9BILA
MVFTGERFVISCVEKGDAESDETDFLNLCTSCWAWRKLPDNYFPQIINELVCQENDFCLSGWGSCTQRYRHVDVLHKQNGSWVPTTVVSGACCDCKIRAGTEVHQLVIGNTQREYRQVDSIIDRAFRATVDQNNPPNRESIDDNPASATSNSPGTQSETTLFPPGELNIGR